MATVSARQLTRKTIETVSIGSNGSRITEVFGGFNVTVLGVKRNHDSIPDGIDEIFPPDELHSVLERSDYAVVACPLTPETRELFDARAFSSMGPDAVFVNIALGGLVDQAVLTEVLQTGNLRGAALDVADEEPLPECSLSGTLRTS